ncbi:MAG: hypothetical protein ACXVZZ_14615 [Terriglobales bacterium]
MNQDRLRQKNWKRWGPYLPERQWATVREDYSAHGNCWDYFPHDHARSRAYRWGGDSGRGCGASHQTGWTALVARLLQKFGSTRSMAVAWPAVAKRVSARHAKAALAGEA